MAAHTYVEMTARLLITLLLCGAIGLQRAISGKAAGVRTHILVGLGSAVMTMVSAYAFPGWPGGAHDPTRIAAQIVSGIGFVGGGMILKEGLTVRGLTTAASLWAVAGVGMAVGSDLVPLAVIATMLLLGTLSLLGRLEQRLPQRRRAHWVLTFMLQDAARVHELHRALRDSCYTVQLVGFETGSGDSGVRVTMELASNQHFDIVRASNELTAAGAIAPQWRSDSYGEDLS